MNHSFVILILVFELFSLKISIILIIQKCFYGIYRKTYLYNNSKLKMSINGNKSRLEFYLNL